MCGIVGLISSEYRKEYFELFKELMKESEVRGKHASGFSFVKEGESDYYKSIEEQPRIYEIFF